MPDAARSQRRAPKAPPPKPPADPGERPAFGALLARVPADVRDVEFSLAVRGYDRHQVDEYIKRVNHVIAELEIASSPQSAVKHALERVGEQTSGVLQRAREAAEELTSTALVESEHATRRAKVEAAETIAGARQEAEALRLRTSQEADALIAGAREEAARRLRDADERARAKHDEAQALMQRLGEQIKSAREARRSALAEVRRTASELVKVAREDPEDGEGGEQSGRALSPGAAPLEPAPTPATDRIAGNGAPDADADAPTRPLKAVRQPRRG